AVQGGERRGGGGGGVAANNANQHESKREPPGTGGSICFISVNSRLTGYSAFASCCGLLMAMVSPTSPTLKRAKRRTEMFSPSLPILLAMSWCTVIPGSFTNG